MMSERAWGGRHPAQLFWRRPLETLTIGVVWVALRQCELYRSIQPRPWPKGEVWELSKSRVW